MVRIDRTNIRSLDIKHLLARTTHSRSGTGPGTVLSCTTARELGFGTKGPGARCVPDGWARGGDSRSLAERQIQALACGRAVTLIPKLIVKPGTLRHHLPREGENL